MLSSESLIAKQKKFTSEYYESKHKLTANYEWEKKKLETVKRLQSIQYISIILIDDDYEHIVIRLDKPDTQSMNILTQQ